MSVPDDWDPNGCQNCEWFLETYRREDLYIFRMGGGVEHVLNEPEAQPRVLDSTHGAEGDGQPPT